LSAGPYAYDGVTAQVNPRLLLAALAADIHGKATLLENTAVTRVIPGDIVTLETASGTHRARRLFVTAGHRSAGLTDAPVTGVKGHALALTPVMTQRPLIYGRDCYVIFHDAMTALGSTTEKEWTDTDIDDAQIELVHARAASVLPAIAAVSVTERWCGIRPRGPNALPYIQETAPNVITSTGGYKIGLALAFTCARLLAADDPALDSAENFWKKADADANLGLFSYA